MQQHITKRWQVVGLVLFSLGLAVFIFSLGLSEYQITEEVITASVRKVTNTKAHTPLLVETTQQMQGKVYSSKFGFLSDLSSALQQAQTQSKDIGFIYDNQIKDFKFWITKKSSTGPLSSANALWWLLGSIVLGSIGALLYIRPTFSGFAGIKHNGIFQHSSTNKGGLGIAVGIFLILFYILLYFFPYYITNWTILVDPVSQLLSGSDASQWFMYGFMYCVVMLVMGVRMFAKYRHNKYQLVRTGSVLFFQLGFAFLLPEIMVQLNTPYMDLKNAWPLDYDYYYDYNIKSMTSSNVGVVMFCWGIALTFIVVPVMAYFFGKRWYCSWVCGCGGLAETLGDPYRQLSDKSLKAWRIERYLVHGVLVFAVVMTGLVLADYMLQDDNGQSVLGGASGTVRTIYGFAIGSVFSGVVGTGFYPLMGNRVWCRFGCPLAALLGIVQKFKSRFRITTNGAQCISCGNCSTYCEMGIDVRWYAQRGQDIVRASCVGCGVCSAVCPRGVLRLENGSVDIDTRAQDQRTIHVRLEDVDIL